jgi:hypothetical protein
VNHFEDIHRSLIRFLLGIGQGEYSFNPVNGKVWYDLSFIDCDPNVGPENPTFCPFIDGQIEMYPFGQGYETCPKAYCKDGICYKTYMQHGSWQDEPTHMCETAGEIHIRTCSGGHAGPQTIDDKAPLPAPAPAPISSPAAISSPAPIAPAAPVNPTSILASIQSAAPTSKSFEMPISVWSSSYDVPDPTPYKLQHDHTTSSLAPAQTLGPAAPNAASAGTHLTASGQFALLAMVIAMVN